MEELAGGGKGGWGTGTGGAECFSMERTGLRMIVCNQILDGGYASFLANANKEAYDCQQSYSLICGGSRDRRRPTTGRLDL